MYIQKIIFAFTQHAKDQSGICAIMNLQPINTMTMYTESEITKHYL